MQEGCAGSAPPTAAGTVRPSQRTGWLHSYLKAAASAANPSSSLARNRERLIYIYIWNLCGNAWKFKHTNEFTPEWITNVINLWKQMKTCENIWESTPGNRLSNDPSSHPSPKWITSWGKPYIARTGPASAWQDPSLLHVYMHRLLHTILYWYCHILSCCIDILRCFSS